MTKTPASRANLQYQWYFNGAQMGGGQSQNATLSLTSVGANNAGNYTVVVNNNWGSVTSAVAVLTVTNPPSLPVQLGAPGMSPAGFSFQFSVPLGSSYVILASTNFQDWTPISTNVALTASVVYTDPAAANYSMRFYRAMLQ